MADRQYQLDAEMYINEPAVDAGREYQASAETYINEPEGGGGDVSIVPFIIWRRSYKHLIVR